MARVSCLSPDSTSSDIINSVAAEAQMPTLRNGPSIADVIMWLHSEPTSKASLARCLAHVYKFQEERGAPPLPNLDEFLVVLGRPRWEWTPRASILFSHIGSIIMDYRRSSPLNEQERRREFMQRRRAAVRRSNRSRRIGREASDATVPTTRPATGPAVSVTFSKGWSFESYCESVGRVSTSVGRW